MSPPPHTPSNAEPIAGERDGVLTLPTSGGCMRPWIWPGGTLEVKRCTLDQLQKGQIAVWFDGRKWVSHRVLELGDDWFRTKGDFLEHPDDVASASQLLGT